MKGSGACIRGEWGKRGEADLVLRVVWIVRVGYVTGAIVAAHLKSRLSGRADAAPRVHYATRLCHPLPVSVAAAAAPAASASAAAETQASAACTT